MSYTSGGEFPLIEVPPDQVIGPLQEFQQQVADAINAVTPGGTVALADPGAPGFVVRTSLGASEARALVAPASGFIINNSDGVAGNATFVLTDDLAAVEALTTTGYAKRTGTSTWVTVSGIADGDLSANVPLKNATNVFTGQNTFDRIGLMNTSPAASTGLTLTNTSISGGGYGANVFVGGNDDADVAWIGGRFSSIWSGGGSSFHATTVGLYGYAQHSGSGRLDSGQGVTGEFYHSGTGHAEQPFGAWNSVTIAGSGTVGAAVGTYSRVFNAGTHVGGSMTSSNPSALFHGQFWQSTLATQPFSAIAGLRLTDWIKGAGSGAIGTSYAIFIDNTTNIGTTPYCFYSTSTAPSLFSGDIVAPSLTMGTTTVGNNPLRVVKTLTNATTAYGEFVQVTNTSTGAFQGIVGSHLEAILATSASGFVTGAEIRATTSAGLSSIAHTGLDILNSVSGAPSSIYAIFHQTQLIAGSSVNNTYGLFTDVAYFTSGMTAFAYGTYTKFRGFGTITGGVGTAIGHYLGAWGTSGITNGYGLYIDSTSVDRASGTKWAIYSLATAPSKFSGQIQGTSLTLTTPLAGAYGGTGSVYVTFTGPTAPRTYSLPDTSTYIATTDGSGVAYMVPKFSPSGSPLVEFINSQILDDGTNIVMGNLSFPAVAIDTGSWILSFGDEAGRQNNSYIRIDDIAQLITIRAMGVNIATTAPGASVNIATSGGVVSIDGQNNSGFATDGGGTTVIGDWNGVGSATIITVSDGASLITLQSAGYQLSFNGPTLGSSSALSISPNGTLTLSPTGNVAFNTTGKHIDPLVNYDQNLGQLSKKYLTLHAAELWVETLVAQSTIATIGGRILVGPTTTLIADCSVGAATIDVKYNNLANGDRIYLEANGSVEFMAVTSGASVITGGFRYSVTRNLDGTGANQWYAGDAAFNTGTTGAGFIDLYSVRGVKTSSQVGPTIVGNIRNSATYNDWSEHWAIGNLNGLYGYGADTPGVGLGKYAAGTPHLTIDVTNGLRIFNGTATVIGQWSAAGVITVGQVAASQSNIIISSGALDLRVNTTIRAHLATDGSGYFANTLFAFDTAGNVTISGNASIAGWTINSAAIVKDTGTNAASSGMAPTDFPFFAGATYANRATAVFRVTPAGALTATSATITGSITATTGAIGGWSIAASTISSGGITLTSNAVAASNKIFVGTGTYNNTNTGFYVDGSGQFSLKDKLTWNGTTLTITGGGTFSGALSAASGTFAGSLSAATGTFAGSLSAASGTFAGSLTAASGTISGTLTMSGASSAIAIGTTPPSSATVGTGIWIDRTGMYGLNGNVLQAKFDGANGKISAAAGALLLDSAGLTLTEGSSAGNQVKWVSSSTTVGQAVAYRVGSDPSKNTIYQTGALSLSGDTAGLATHYSYAMANQGSDGNEAILALNRYSSSHATQAGKATGVLNVKDGFVIGTGISVFTIPNAMLDVRGTMYVTGAFLLALQTPNSTGTAAFGVDQSAGAQLTIANNATATPFGNSNNFSGIIIINDPVMTGHTGMFIVGGSASVSLVGQSVAGGLFTTTSGTAGKVNVFASGGVVTIENKQGGTIDFRVWSLRMRNSG